MYSEVALVLVPGVLASLCKGAGVSILSPLRPAKRLRQ